MKSLSEHLSQYAAYHRDRRNIATHFIGIPTIVLSVIFLLWHPLWSVGSPVPVNPALLAVIGASLFYLRLDLRFGLLMLILLLVGFFGVRHLVDGEPRSFAWIWGGVLFAVGWAVQFLGHIWEGRKPAFVDDLVGLLVGPLFVVSELVFFGGFRRELADFIEKQAGPTRSGRKLPSS